jgi:thiamine biosynthesis lipoprotein
MSTWRPDSEISRFNAAIAPTPFKASRGLLEVVALSLEISAASDGAFDVTVAPLIAAWGFGPKGRHQARRAPTEAELAALRARIGWQQASTSTCPTGHYKRTSPTPRARALRDRPRLRRRPHRRGLRALGHPHPRRRRRRDPRQRPRAPRRPVAARHRAPRHHRRRRPRRRAAVTTRPSPPRATTATTTSSRRRPPLAHPRPADRPPIAHRLASVSVLHRSAALADGWATALNVLGPDAGLALATQQVHPRPVPRPRARRHASRERTAPLTRPCIRTPRAATLDPP